MLPPPQAQLAVPARQRRPSRCWPQAVLPRPRPLERLAWPQAHFPMRAAVGGRRMRVGAWGGSCEVVSTRAPTHPPCAAHLQAWLDASSLRAPPRGPALPLPWVLQCPATRAPALRPVRFRQVQIWGQSSGASEFVVPARCSGPQGPLPTNGLLPHAQALLPRGLDAGPASLSLALLVALHGAGVELFQCLAAVFSQAERATNW